MSGYATEILGRPAYFDRFNSSLMLTVRNRLISSHAGAALLGDRRLGASLSRRGRLAVRLVLIFERDAGEVAIAADAAEMRMFMRAHRSLVGCFPALRIVSARNRSP